MQSLERIQLNFANSLRSEQTRLKYEYGLKKFLLFNKISIDKFLSLPIADIENMMIDYIIDLKKQGLSTSYIKMILASIKHLCVMNDVVINVKKIGKFIGESTKLQEDRPYTHEEILQLLNVCDLRMKAVILLLASTGIRIGALPTLRVRDVDVDATRNWVTVYSDSKDKYITFMTPECSKAITEYLNFRKRSGEKLTPDSPLIREQFDITDQESIRKNSRFVSRDAYSSIVRHALIKSGLRVVNHNYGGRHRHKITAADGFRKFFTNQLIQADVKTEIRWLLEGHDLKGNDRYYVRLTEQKLYEEYQKAVDLLTIDPSNLLKQRVDELEKKEDQLRNVLDRLNEMDKQFKAAMAAKA